MTFEPRFSAAFLASLERDKRAELLADLSAEQLTELFYAWEFWARPSQLAPETNPRADGGQWTTWIIMGGRGVGKTRTGAETVRKWVNAGHRTFALVGATATDVRDTMIIGTEQAPGIMGVFPPHQTPLYVPSRRFIRFHTGATAHTFSAEKPDQLRGPQFEKAWGDEICKWQRDVATWDNLLFGLRKGETPQAVLTTTPRPTKLIRRILDDRSTVITRGRTIENRANLSARFMEEVTKKYAGTRLGKQELDGELLEDVEGALWQQEGLDRLRVEQAPKSLARVVVGVDPSVAGEDVDDDGRKRDDCGIVVAARADAKRAFAQRYVLGDYTLNAAPAVWAREVVRVYWMHKADLVVAESNNGGDLVRMAIHQVDPRVPVKLVPAKRGKYTRAEPVALAYERGEVHHVGILLALEDEMTSWTPDPTKASPNRIDALVWAITEDLEGVNSSVFV